MDTNTLSSEVAAVALSLTATYASNRNLSTDSKQTVVLKVWESMVRGARKYCEEQGFVTIHNMYLSLREEDDLKLRSDAGVGMARVVQFILGQTGIRECVPFLINRENDI